MPEAIDIGPQLLGRKPSLPDSRDYKLADYLRSGPHATSADPLDALLAAFLKKRYSQAAKDLATALVQRLEALSPAPTPGPTPTPDPTPTPIPTPTPSGEVVWADSEAVLDQGKYGTCVGNGWAQWGNTDPINDRYDEAAARAIYYEATVIDGQPDDPDVPGGGQQGSTVRSGAKAMQNRKRLSAYAFAANIQEVVDWVSTKGPVVFGTEWTNGMFTPDDNGFVSPADGKVAGGHCYVCVGYLPGEKALLFQNSWGTSWGLNGRFKMTIADASKLFQSQGEACAAVELAAA